jgi:hypothetical protein
MSFLRRNRQPIPELHIDANAVSDETLDRSDAIKTDLTGGFVDVTAAAEQVEAAQWKKDQGF